METRTRWEAPEQWLVVFDSNGQHIRIDVAEESKIDAAVSTFVTAKQDALLHVDTIEGEEYVILASEVKSWFRSTFDMRERAEIVDEKIKSERKARGWTDDL